VTTTAFRLVGSAASGLLLPTNEPTSRAGEVGLDIKKLHAFIYEAKRRLHGDSCPLQAASKFPLKDLKE
jgi:hypothetical protein